MRYAYPIGKSVEDQYELVKIAITAVKEAVKHRETKYFHRTGTIATGILLDLGYASNV